MGIAANFIARYIERYRWIAYVGLAVILWVAVKMIWDGWHDVAPVLGWPMRPLHWAAAWRVDDTIFALSSGRPPAAIAIIRVSGPSAHCRGERRWRAHCRRRATPRCASFGDPATASCIDEALVLRFDGPASATGEDVVEFQCHGGRAVVDAVLGALAASTACGWPSRANSPAGRSTTAAST